MSEAATPRRTLKLTGRLIQPEPVREDSRSRQPFPRVPQPVRIVILDDVEPVRNFYRLVLRAQFPAVEFFECTDGSAAYTELSYRHPDLFITDITHPGMHVAELVGRLGERGVRYPVSVISSVIQSCNDNVRAQWSSRLNISFWPKPVPVNKWVAAMRSAVSASRPTA